MLCNVRSDREHSTTPVIEVLEERLLLSGAAPAFVSPLQDLYFYDTAAQTIYVKASDSDTANLTITAVSSTPGLDVYVSNRFATLKFVEEDGTTEIGEIVVVLFEDRALDQVQRFINLATYNYIEIDDVVQVNPGADPFYTNVPVHRVIPGFMIQTGDGENGDGTGDSLLADLPTVTHPLLDFAGAGVLASANSGGATNDAQFFITQEPTNWLYGSHTIFGQLIEGWDVLDNIINRETGANDRPLSTPLLKQVTVETAAKSTAIRVTPDQFSGSGKVTVTLDDGDGNVTTQTITVSVPLDRKTSFVDTSTGSAESAVAVGNRLYVAGGSAGLLIYDITDRENPVYLTAYKYEDDCIVRDVAVQGTTVFVIDQVNGFISLDASNLGNMVLLDLVAPTGDNNLPLGIELVGNTAYVTQYEAGLVVYDVSNPLNINRIGGQAESQPTWYFRSMDVKVEGKLAFVSESYGGIYILDVSKPAEMKVIGAIFSGADTWSIDLQGNYLYVLNGTDHLLVYDVSKPKAYDINRQNVSGQIPPVGHLYVGSSPWRVTVLNESAFVGIDGGYSIVDVSVPTSMIVEFSLPATTRSQLVGTVPLLVDDQLYVFLGSSNGSSGAEMMVVDAQMLLGRKSIFKSHTVVIDPSTKATIGVSGGLARIYCDGFAGSGQILGIDYYSSSTGSASKGSLNIKGKGVTVGDIVVYGDDGIGKINAKGVTVDGDILATGPVGSITIGGIEPDGRITASSLGRISATGGLVADIEAEGAIAGISAGGNSGGNWSAESIGSITVKGNLSNSNINLSAEGAAVALGKMSVSGWIDGVNLVSAGSISSITAGGMRNSSVMVAVTTPVDILGGVGGDGVYDLPSVTGDLVAASPASIGKFQVTGKVNDGAFSFVNSNVAAPTILNAAVSYANTNGVPFGLAARSLGTLKYKQVGQAGTLKDPQEDWAIDNFQVKIL